MITKTLGVVEAGGTSVTLPGCTAGRGLIFGAWFYSDTATISGVAVAGESGAVMIPNTFARTPAGQSYFTCQIGHLPQLATGGDKTVTITLSVTPTYPGGVWVMEVDGHDVAAFHSGGAAGNNFVGPAHASTAEFSCSVTTPFDNCFIASFCEITAGGDPAPPTGYTPFTLANTSSYVHGAFIPDAGVAGVKADVWAGFVGGAGVGMSSAAFNPSGGAPPPTLVTYHPTGDGSVGSWTSSSGSGTLASHIDESTPNDADFVQSASNPSGALDVALIGGDGTTVIATWTHPAVPSGYTDYEQVLSAGEISAWAAAGYSGSILRFTADGDSYDAIFASVPTPLVGTDHKVMYRIRADA